MKFKEFTKKFYSDITNGISRFSVAFVCTVLLFFTISYAIVFDTTSDGIIIPLCMTFALVSVLSVLLKCAQEYICQKFSSKMQYILCSISGIIGFILIKANYDSLYTLMTCAGIIISMVCFIFFVLMRGENRNFAFPRLVTSLVFSAAICGVLSIGISTCIAAFHLLIFDWDNIYKVYLIFNLFIWVVVYINVFLAFIPKKDILVPQSKIFRAIILFAGLPLYMLLIAILLIYLAKIVITWNMPVGEINWFASFASLFFIFFLLSVMQYTEKAAKLFARFGGYLLVPVLIMQAIAVFERINAYGLTTPRTVSLVLILISIIFIAGSIVIPKHLNKIPLISGIIVLFFTITPCNIIDMPVTSQTRILKTVLTDNNMLIDNKVIPNPAIDKSDAQKILSAYQYLKYDAEKVPEFIPNSEQTTLEIFGFTDDYTEERNYTYCNFKTKDSVDISNYDNMIIANVENNMIKFEHNAIERNIDLKPIAEDLYAQHGSQKTDLELYKVDENTALYFDSFDFDVENNEVTHCYFYGYVLLKN